MKKLLILALVVTIAGAAFADTDPAFSGTFSTYMGYSVENQNVVDSASDKMALDLNATIDDYNMVTVKVGLADAIQWDTEGQVNNANTSYDWAPAAGDDLKNSSDFLKMDAFYLTHDLFGVLGVDGPVGLKLKLGKFNVASSDVSKVANTNYAGGSKTASDVGIGFDISILDMVTLSTAVYPDQWVDSSFDEFAVNLSAMGIADMIDFNAYYVMSARNTNTDVYGDTIDNNGDSIGASVAVAIMDGLDVGVSFEQDLDASTTFIGLNVGFAMDALGVGLAYRITDLSAASIVDAMDLKLGLTYDVSDMFGLYGAFGISFAEVSSNLNTALFYDAGLTTALGAVDVQLGFSDDFDFKAPEDDFSNVIYVKFSTSF